MLDIEKIKLMTELAFYEQNEGKEDLKINEYYRKDYTGYHVICSIFWVTIGYAAIVGLVLMAGLDVVLDNMSKSMLMKMILVIMAIYFVVVIIYTLLTHYIYSRKHREARDRLTGFNHNLIKLLKMYDKERQ